MAKFYMMAKYTPEALKGFMSKATDDRKAASAKLVESVGGSLLSFDIVRGDYDLVMVVDAIDFNAAAGAKKAVQSTGIVTQAVILGAGGMTENFSKTGTELGSYTKTGG